MGTQKEFDDLMREKLEGFEADPPARIWAAVQAEVASPDKDRRRIGAWWYLGVAAAVALLAAATWLFWPASNAGLESKDMADKGLIKQDNPNTAAIDSSLQIGTNPDSNAPAKVLDIQQASTPRAIQKENIAQAPAPIQEKEAPIQLQDLPREEIEMIAKDEPMPIMEEQHPIEEEQKALPTYAELASSRVSKGVLGAVTTSAREMFGVDTHYYEEQTASAKTTTFTADLKFIKVTRVRKVKTGPS